MTTTLVTRAVSAIAENIHTAWEQFLIDGNKAASGGRRAYVYASTYRECTRRMALELTDADKLPPWTADNLANFRRGQDRERDLLSDLKRIGRTCDPQFEVIAEQERFELRDRKGRVAIVGKVDARLQFDRSARPPIEVKSWNPQTVARIGSFEDLFNSPWTKAGAYQLLAYLFGSGEPYGFLLLDRPGIPLLLPVELIPNLGRVEEFLTRAERALDAVSAGTLPDYIQDAGECKRCGFYGAVCNPPIGGDGAVVLTDPELEAMLERREELKEAALEYDGIDSDVKRKLRGVEQGIAGKFAIFGKWGKSTKYDIPSEIKNQYAKVDPKGRFTLEITKL